MLSTVFRGAPSAEPDHRAQMLLDHNLTRLGLLFTCNSLEPFGMLGWPLLSIRLAPAVAVDLAGKSSSNLLSPTYPHLPATASLTYHRVYCSTSLASRAAILFRSAIAWLPVFCVCFLTVHTYFRQTALLDWIRIETPTIGYTTWGARNIHSLTRTHVEHTSQTRCNNESYCRRLLHCALSISHVGFTKENAIVWSYCSAFANHKVNANLVCPSQSTLQ